MKFINFFNSPINFFNSPLNYAKYQSARHRQNPQVAIFGRVRPQPQIPSPSNVSYGRASSGCSPNGNFSSSWPDKQVITPLAACCSSKVTFLATSFNCSIASTCLRCNAKCVSSVIVAWLSSPELTA